jgi:TPR repeat protein
LMIAVVALVGGCASTPKVVPNSPETAAAIEAAIRKAANKPTGELTKADLEKVAGTYLVVEGDSNEGVVLLKNGLVEIYKNGKSSGGRQKVRWDIRDGEVHIGGPAGVAIFRIKPDGNLTFFARIKNGKREDIPKDTALPLHQLTYKKIESQKQTQPAPVNAKQRKIDLLMKAAEEGDRESAFELAVRFDQGDEVAANKEKAIRWFRRAAVGKPVALTQVKAQASLGALYGETKNYHEARTWLERAAGFGEPMSMMHLSHMHKNGLGGPKNKVMAMAYITLAHVYGKTNGKRYGISNPVPNLKQAVKSFAPVSKAEVDAMQAKVNQMQQDVLRALRANPKLLQD